jgi:L-malate glycosyltransferase
LNILHIATGLGRGGIERLICDLTLAQVQAGHRVRVLTVWTTGELESEALQAGAAVDCCNIPREGWTRKALSWSGWLKGYLKQHQIDAIIEHGCLEGYVARAGAAVGVPGMVSVIHSTYRGRLRYRLHRRLQHHVFLRRYARFVAVSQSVRQHEIEYYRTPAERIAVIPNGIVTRRFALERPGLEEKRRRLGLDLTENEIVVGTVGNLREPKNHALLLRAWARLRREYAGPLRLIIVGEGDLRASLERQRDELGLSQDVVFLGSRADVPALLACFDIFVMSSQFEGHPVVALEAMAAGLPVVATNVSGLRDVVHEGSNGLLAEANDPSGLAGGIARLAGDGALREAMGRAGRQLVEQEYSLERCAQTYERILLESSLKHHA